MKTARAGLLALSGGLLALGLTLSLTQRSGPSGGAAIETARWALSPQECITECQSRQTDCIQYCDGKVSCEKECVGAGERCVARCRSDAGAAPGTPPPGAPAPVPPPRTPPPQAPPSVPPRPR